MLNPDEEDILANLHEFNEKRAMQISFSLAMRDDDGKIETYERINQPCYGELRKYKKTHGDECTRPESNRPGDLQDPFPAGIPEALAIGLPDWTNGGFGGNKPLFDYLFSDRSPFKKGFISEKNIEWSKDNKGFVLLDTSFDPTVLVNLLKHLQMNCVQGYYSKNYHPMPNSRERPFVKYLNLGLSEIEAFFLDYSVWYNSQGSTIEPANDYIYPVHLDIQRILNQNPVDLTGGTLRDRFDYNRKEMHKIFALSEKEGGVSFFQKIISKMDLSMHDAERGKAALPYERLVELFKEVYAEVMQGQERKAA